MVCPPWSFKTGCLPINNIPRGRDNLGTMTRWLVVMALLAGCATRQAAQPGCKMMWTGQPPVQVDSCTGRGEDLMAGWHWYDYLFGVSLGMVGVL